MAVEPSRGGRGLVEQLVQSLGRSVLGGQLAAGAKLVPGEMEDQFGVSRSVVREALAILTAKGLVEARPRRGTVVRPRSDWELLDADILRWQFEVNPSQRLLDALAELRMILEPDVARLAAQRRTDAHLAELDAALADMRADSVRVRVDADVRFHTTLLRAAGNELLTCMDTILEAGLRMRDEFVHQQSVSPDALPLHITVRDAVAGDDPRQAERAMRQLLEFSAEEAELAHDRHTQPATGPPGPTA